MTEVQTSPNAGSAPTDSELIARYLKEQNPDVQLIAVQPEDELAVVEGLKHLETARVPSIYDPTLVDQREVVSPFESVFGQTAGDRSFSRLISDAVVIAEQGGVGPEIRSLPPEHGAARVRGKLLIGEADGDCLAVGFELQCPGHRLVIRACARRLRCFHLPPISSQSVALFQLH